MLPADQEPADTVHARSWQHPEGLSPHRYRQPDSPRQQTTGKGLVQARRPPGQGSTASATYGQAVAGDTPKPAADERSGWRTASWGMVELFSFDRSICDRACGYVNRPDTSKANIATQGDSDKGFEHPTFIGCDCVLT